MSQMLDRIAGPMIALGAPVYQPLLDDIIKKETQAREGSHRRIVDAICAGDGEQARGSMQTHILTFWQMWLGETAQDQDAVLKSSQAIDDSIDLLESFSSMFSRIA
jgi:hypothetical protein